MLVAGFFIGQFASSFLAMLFAAVNGADLAEMVNKPETLYDNISQTQVLLSQALYTLTFTFLVPWFYLKLIVKKKLSDIHRTSVPMALPALITVLATMAFMTANTFLIEWNVNLDLPDGAFEDQLKQMEESLAEMTERFTRFDNFGSFLLGFIVIAVLPGIGEELMFRGVLQNSLHKYSGNKHVAVWVTGFIFAAIHLQFYGLFPRMMLGVLFGYLYVWSGNLWLPIISHIVNNGLAVILAYYAQVSETDLDIDDPTSLPVWLAIAATALLAGLLFLFRNYYLRSKSTHEQLASHIQDHPGASGADS